VEWTKERQYAEEVGMALAGMGMTPAFGKLLGWLLICDPPTQSLAQLSSALELSKGSVSTGMRGLERSGLVRRVAMPGHRGHVYEAAPDAFIEIGSRAAEQYAAMRRLIERGLALLDDEYSARARRLRTHRDFYLFIEREVPKLLGQFRDRYRDQTREEDSDG
jgi:DNA-binding transcriptional regulator GbsR (MarR family)